ncbi:MAG TPA: hypothetical protein DSN98_04550 [Thermoplasmata archaeon]|nr:MAG TPA: hypothetical protein DSN98_04550 [Thermoplasmata archaeon]
MRKNLIVGSLLAVFLMMMLPTVAAAEAKVAQSATTSPNLLSIQTAYVEAIRAKYKDDPSPQTFILLTLAILFLKLLRWGSIIVIGAILLVILKVIGGRNNTTAVGC